MYVCINACMYSIRENYNIKLIILKVLISNCIIPYSLTALYHINFFVVLYRIH